MMKSLKESCKPETCITFKGVVIGSEGWRTLAEKNGLMWMNIQSNTSFLKTRTCLLKWQQDIGPNWREVQETLLHTIGNLTLTGYNSEYSDRPFVEKRDMPGGFRESPLKLNKGLGQLDHWNEDTIKERAGRLCDLATNVWSAPALSKDILEAYKPKADLKSGYTIEDYHHLQSGQVGELFHAFRKEVLSLDPVVMEEFLKLYVAYKAETKLCRRSASGETNATVP